MQVYEINLFLEARTVGLASSVVCALFVHTECVPSSGSEDLFLRNVVHANGDSEHRAESDEISTDVTVADGTVVSAPVVHYVVSGLEGAAFLTVATRSEPSAGPGGIGTHHKSLCYVVRKLNCPTFCYLKYRTETLNKVKTDHSAGHFSKGVEVA